MRYLNSITGLPDIPCQIKFLMSQDNGRGNITEIKASESEMVLVWQDGSTSYIDMTWVNKLNDPNERNALLYNDTIFFLNKDITENIHRVNPNELYDYVNEYLQTCGIQKMWLNQVPKNHDSVLSHFIDLSEERLLHRLVEAYPEMDLETLRQFKASKYAASQRPNLPPGHGYKQIDE